MKRLHIATLGLNRNDLVGYVIRKRPVDNVALVHTSENWDDMEKLKIENESSGIPVETVEVMPWDYSNVLARILEVVSRYETHRLEFNPSCGTRVMTAAAYMASLMTDAPVYFVTDPQEDGFGDVIQILPMSFAMLSEKRRKFLKEIGGQVGAINSYREIKDATDLSISQISKHVRSLEKVGYVKVSRRGKESYVQTTDLGQIIINMKTYRKGRVWGK